MTNVSLGQRASTQQPSKNERSSLLSIEEDQGLSSFSSLHNWLPSRVETQSSIARHPGSWRRSIFLILTEPDTSIWSAVFFIVLILVIALSNIIMIMQTMNAFQFVPTDCVSCGGTTSYLFEDDEVAPEMAPGVSCVCPPSPVPWTIQTLDLLIYFLTFEWILRVVVYSPANPSATGSGRVVQWFNFLTDPTTFIDALSIFPYYLERLPNGLVSLRIFRLLRIFQLVRLGQYNPAFTSLTNVMSRSTQYLKLLVIVLAFGAAFFGSMVYWMEKGTWKYHEASGEYTFVRTGFDGKTEEPTPFTSIPAAFWWFLVTATTVGYGDMYPTSTGGRYVAVLAMMMGVLVIAFPVSVFSELWEQELRDMNGFDHIAGKVAVDNNTPIKNEITDNIGDRVTLPSHREEDSCLKRNNQELIVLDQSDMQEVLNCLDGIREREQRIRILLKSSTKIALNDEYFDTVKAVSSL